MMGFIFEKIRQFSVNREVMSSKSGVLPDTFETHYSKMAVSSELGGFNDLDCPVGFRTDGPIG